MAPRSQPYRLQWPLDQRGVDDLDTMLQMLFDDIANGSIDIDLTTQVGETILPVANGGTGADNSTYTYTPTLTAVANVAASTAYTAQYVQVGSIVFVSGKFEADPTAGATLTQLRMTLPITSSLTAEEQLGGTAHGTTNDSGARIYADTTNDAAIIEWTPTDAGNQSYSFMFSYQVV